MRGISRRASAKMVPGGADRRIRTGSGGSGAVAARGAATAAAAASG